MRLPSRALAAAWLLLLGAASAAAQSDAPPDPSESAFTLSSSEVFTTHDSPSFSLTFRHLTQLDFRVYRVRDPFAFFSGLRDPHQLGSEERPVPQERSWIERIADWKAGQRRRIRGFFRDQVSHDYRAARRASQDKREVAQRLVLNETSFASVPLLNPDQLVTAWRELLPDRRDAEYRRVPLDVKAQPGVYLVEAVSNLLRAYTVVIVSDTGLVTKTAPGQLLMFAADRFSGDPKAGCDVQVLVNQQVVANGRTDGDGVVSLALPAAKAEEVVGVARCGDQVAATDPGGYFANEPQRQLLGYIYTDKPVYRPGHTAHIKAVLRWRERDAIAPFDRPTAEISITDTNEKVVFRQSSTPDAFGAIAATFPVPATAALGSYSIRVASGDEQAGGGFDVQEYRRPEFEVIVTPAARFVVQGQDAVATVQARYYFGQPVANARVRYVVNQQAYYSPLRWSDGSDDEEGGQYWYGDDQKIEGELRLDAQGRGEIRVPLSSDEQGRDFSARIEAQVTDASSREVSGNTVVHATYGPFLIASQVSGYVFSPSQRVPVTLRAIDYLGAPRPGVPITVVLERIRYPEGRYSEPDATAVNTTSATTAADGSATATLALPAGSGTFRVRATTTVDHREIKSDTWMSIAGPDETTASPEDRYLELTADKKTYAPGETARLIARGEAVSGPILVTKEGQSVTWHRVVKLAAGDAIEVPIEPGDIGDIYVNIAFMREGRLNQAERRLSVPATDRTLQITLTADRATAKPQEPGVFTLRVLDPAGAPVSAQVSLAVIDEAVYAIRPDDTPDPVRFFYRREYTRVGTSFSRDYYFVGYSGTDRLKLTMNGRRRPFTLADFKGDKQVQPQVRKDFPDAIYWIGDLVTDAAGQAKVAVKYPDALTTWRLTARAVTRDTKAGTAVARTTTTKDLIVRVITPRFLTEGDEVVLPTIVHNYLDGAKETSVTFTAKNLEALDGTNASGTTSASGSIDKNGERRDDWRFRAASMGDAVVSATAKTDADGDAVELTVPVLPYGLRREAGTSGTLAGVGEQFTEVDIPASSNPGARTISVSLAPSMAGSLLGALDYLTSFPYGCTEQTLSSFLPNVMVTRAMTQLKLAPTERLSALDRQTAAGVQRLYDFQHDDGGWGWWKADENHPFMTAYAIYGLNEARHAGYRVEDYRIQNGVRALAGMYAEYPRAEPDLKAYMAYVLRRAEPDADAIGYGPNGNARGGTYRHDAARNELWEARTRMSPYGRALLLLLLDEAKDVRGDELARTLAGEAQTKGELTWWAVDHDPMLFDFADTTVETTATAVRALARRDPSNPLLDRAIRWLMLNRKGGYWSTTKQTAIALYGLLEVLQARNESAEAFSVDVYVNDTLAGSRAFSADAMAASDPIVIQTAGREGANAIRLVKKGGGRLYWSARGTYFDTQGAQARSGSRELAITRKYARLAAVQQKDRIVYREEPFDGRINPGDVLTVRLTIAGAKDWRYLIVEDPLPAGVEAIQDTTAYPMERADRWRWWWGSQVEYRDSRTVFFQERFDQGRYEYVYLVKAISSGQFRAAPAQVAPMYVPGVAASSEPRAVTVTVVGESQR